MRDFDPQLARTFGNTSMTPDHMAFVIVNKHFMVAITAQIIVRRNIYCAMQYILLTSPAGSDTCMQIVTLLFSSTTDQNP